jgi:chromosome segregation ATPase
VKSTGPQTVPRELQALRSSLDARLNALETALADPSQQEALEDLILDLARVATEEADAAARQAYLDAQQQAQNAIAAARTEGLSALEAEKAAAATLRQAVDEAKVALNAERSAVAAAQKEAAAARQDLEQEQASRSTLKREIEQEQASRSGLKRDLETALVALKAERATSAGLKKAVEQAQGEAQAARAEAASRDEELAAVRQALEAELQKQHTTDAGARRDVEQALQAVEAEKATVAELRQTISRLERDLVKALTELKSSRQELDGSRRDAEARSKTLSGTQAELEQTLRAAQQSARDAQAKAEEAGRERDALKKQLDSATQEAGREQDKIKKQLEAAVQEAGRERDKVKKQLDAAVQEASRERDKLKKQLESASHAASAGDSETASKYEQLQQVSEQRIRALELAVRDAETRAEAAEAELQQQRRAAAFHPTAKPTEAAMAPDSSEASGKSSVSPKAPATAADEAAPYAGPARAAKRVSIDELDVQIDGSPAKLIDLSVTGAQVLASTSMKPNRVVKLTLPNPQKAITCKGKVMWARLEPREGQIWYRAGVFFTTADQKALEAFLKGLESAR